MPTIPLPLEINCSIDLDATDVVAGRIEPRHSGPFCESLHSIRITRQKVVWQFPASRFVEYEEKDEAWARPLKFGHPEPQTFVQEIPHARITAMGPRSISFEAVPAREVMLMGFDVTG